MVTWHINFTEAEIKEIEKAEKLLKKFYYMRKCSHHDFILIAAALTTHNILELNHNLNTIRRKTKNGRTNNRG